MKYLITGGCGFLGSNLACHVLEKGHELFVYDNLSRQGSRQNLDWLKQFGAFEFKEADVADPIAIESSIKDFRPDVIFHLAGQVAMTTSIKDPGLDFRTNVLGSFQLLEAVRKYRSEATVIYSSTNKVYGDLEYLNYQENELRYVCKDYPEGFPENIQLEFHSPYGVSKGSADQYMLDYARIFGLKTVVFRHSSMYGGRQFVTKDQGWIGWFIQKAIEQKTNKTKEAFSIAGNGKQVRDLLFADDMIQLYFLVAENIDKVAGQVFNVGGGMKNSSSLLELFSFLEQELDVRLDYHQTPARKSDQKVFVANLTKLANLIGWQPQVSKEVGLKKMINWVLEIEKKSPKN